MSHEPLCIAFALEKQLGEVLTFQSSFEVAEVAELHQSLPEGPVDFPGEANNCSCEAW